MRVLGLDIGDRYIGVAISDPGEVIASPLTVLIRNNDDQTVSNIADLVRKNNIQRLVVGVPYTLSSQSNTQTVKTEAFAQKLSENLLGVEIIKQDERLTTVVAKRLLLEAKRKRKRHKSQLDAASAAVILQGYLDGIKLQDNSLQEIGM